MKFKDVSDKEYSRLLKAVTENISKMDTVDRIEDYFTAIEMVEDFPSTDDLISSCIFRDFIESLKTYAWINRKSEVITTYCYDTWNGSLIERIAV